MALRRPRPHTVTMESKKVWFITGAGRGMGVAIAKAALAAGHAVTPGRDLRARRRREGSLENR
jgi:NAD(P)-dependent dehydrogenase (short-subunit alcohol dehydrogenase family)